MTKHRGHNPEAELKRMQRQALACLLLASIIFVATLFLPPTFLVRLLKAGAEAAMVGGLADWFAVVALFRRPLGLPIPHTAIVPNSKDRIADNLAEFVREKFLDPKSLLELIQRSDPVQRVAAWLTEPANAGRLGRHATDIFSKSLDWVDDRRIQAFISDAARTAIGKLDFAQALGSVLSLLTKGGRHQHLLDTALDHLADELRKPDVRKSIADRVVAWIKSEHKWKQMVLPTEWLGDKAAEGASEGLDKLLEEIANSPNHELRKHFDKTLQSLITRLQTDEAFRRKGEEVRNFIQNDPALAEYLRGLWTSVRDWISQDLEGSSSQIQHQIQSMGLWLGHKLAEDDELRASFNQHIQEGVSSAAPQFAEFLTRHISDTVRKWNPTDMSRQIELSIGPDLQYIRISGTAVGCCIGVALFLISHIPEIVR
ncbi:DUF445 domain-containing protein [Achromobacter sp.]|uniref:DUF445 domain-containing protein n=1 Tax=Achromobacter sp. TaxID=134375 RepID=UPI0028971842|nr:DUF445 domain-containing protein [Achromobacter sp.]